MVAKYGPDEYNYKDELHSSPQQRLMIAGVKRRLHASFDRDGRGGSLRQRRSEAEKRAWGEVMLAGTDRVPLDAIGVALLRHLGTTPEVSPGPIFQQEQIARAIELGLGVAGPDKIELVTADPDSEAYAAQIRKILLRG